MKGVKYINTDPLSKDRLSHTACALILPLVVLANSDNEINKKSFIARVGWITDYRTWNKYWAELVDNAVLVQIDKRMWMVSPHECYAEGISHNALIIKWNEARNAIN